MKFEILITDSAIIDITEGINYYNDKVPGLGNRFFADIEINLEIVSNHPEAFGEKHKGVRGKMLKHFPYLIVYRIKKQSLAIEIMRIFNTYQNPYWG